jgi:type IV pilus assembly protein PilC
MPKFHYLALDQNGQETAGDIDAASDTDAINALRSQQLYVTKVVQEGRGDASEIKSKAAKTARTRGGGSSGKSAGSLTIKSKALMVFTRQLATLIDAGLPIMQGLSVLASQESTPNMKRMINSLAESVQGGGNFSDGLTGFPKIFNKLYVNMVKAGELGGILEVVLNRLSEYQEKAQKLKNKIVSAMVYPIIVMLIAVVIMIFLMLVIVPKFEKIFDDMIPGGRSKLPALTQWVIGISRGIGENFLYLLIIAAVFIVAWRIFASTAAGKLAIDRLKLQLPLFGDVQRKSAISRFSRTLGTLLTSGVPVLQAMSITRETAGNIVVADVVSKAYEDVKEGESMAPALAKSGVFPAMVTSMVVVGDQTGQLPEMLLKIADVYEDEVDNSVSALTSMLEPLMIVLLAVVVGVIVMALFMPLISVINNLQNAG